MQKNNQQLNLKTPVTKLLSVLSDRNGSIVALRHGIKGGDKNTLEAIGKKYNITRERVRQIEEASYDKLRGSSEFGLIDPAVSAIGEFLNDHSGVATEEQLMQNLTTEDQSPYLSLVLSLSDFVKVAENDNFKAIWAINKERAQQVRDVLKDTADHLVELEKPVEQEQLLGLVKDKNKHNLPLHEENTHAVLSMSKQIKKGPFEKWGLSKWAQINPRGVRDKAHLVMERHGEPLHFKELAQKIDEYLHEGKTNTHPQTAHNELIKDKRFVLIGRGTYALADWGYVPGTVKDVIIKVLQDEGKPVDRSELVNRVMQQRKVQESTVLLNLQNRDLFKKQGSKYHLA